MSTEQTLEQSKTEGLIALDARIVLHEPTVTENKLPKLAIRPYPTQYVGSWTMKGGTTLTIRPIRPEDEPLLVKFHQSLSEESVYLRYAHLIKLSTRIAHERLTRICFIDYDREMALVADHRDQQTGEHKIVAVGRLSKLHGTNEAEFALLVNDQYQCRGLGTELLRRLLQIGQDERLSQITADILPHNLTMQHVCKKLGFHLRQELLEPMLKAEYIYQPLRQAVR